MAPSVGSIYGFVKFPLTSAGACRHLACLRCHIDWTLRNGRARRSERASITRRSPALRAAQWTVTKQSRAIFTSKAITMAACDIEISPFRFPSTERQSDQHALLRNERCPKIFYLSLRSPSVSVRVIAGTEPSTPRAERQSRDLGPGTCLIETSRRSLNRLDN